LCGQFWNSNHNRTHSEQGIVPGSKLGQCGVAKQFDELAPPHWMTSSAVVSNTGGMTRPSAVAVFTLTAKYMDELPADAVVTVDCARISPGDAMSDRADSAELLDIDNTRRSLSGADAV
jgi:hypothetical protein